MNTLASPARDSAMADEEHCAVCGRLVDGAAFCHLYSDGRRTSLCGPKCAEEYFQRDLSAGAPSEGWTRDYSVPSE